MGEHGYHKAIELRGKANAASRAASEPARHGGDAAALHSEAARLHGDVLAHLKEAPFRYSPVSRLEHSQEKADRRSEVQQTEKTIAGHYDAAAKAKATATAVVVKPKTPGAVIVEKKKAAKVAKEAKATATAATVKASMASVHAESHKRADMDSHARETKAAEAHTEAAKAHRVAGREDVATAHEKSAARHRDTAASTKSYLQGSGQWDESKHPRGEGGKFG